MYVQTMNMNVALTPKPISTYCNDEDERSCVKNKTETHCARCLRTKRSTKRLLYTNANKTQQHKTVLFFTIGKLYCVKTLFIAYFLSCDKPELQNKILSMVCQRLPGHFSHSITRETPRDLPSSLGSP